MSTDEEWRVVPGLPLYEVSSFGSVRSWAVRGFLGRRAKKSTLLTPSLHREGYLRVKLGRERGAESVHVLVALAFIGPKGDAEVCRHLDNNPTNNVPWNLAWGTQAENMADKERHGTAQKGERNANAKLTADDVRAIRASTEVARVLAKRYGISRGRVATLKTGRGWKHVA